MHLAFQKLILNHVYSIIWPMYFIVRVSYGILGFSVDSLCCFGLVFLIIERRHFWTVVAGAVQNFILVVVDTK